MPRALWPLAAILAILTLASGASAADSFNMIQVARATGGRSIATVVQGNIAYVAADKVLNLVDVSDPMQPELVVSVDTPGGANGLALNGTTLYVAQGNEGLGVYSLTPPTTVNHVRTLATAGNAVNCWVSGAYLYLADRFGGLRVYEVSIATNPVHYGTFSLPEFDVEDVKVFGNYAYVMGIRQEWDLFFPTLKILDVTIPGIPQERVSQEYPWQGFRGEVVVDGSTVYLADGVGAIHVSTFVPPSTLIPVTTIYGPASAIELDGSTLHTASYRSFESFDVSDLANVTSLGTVPTLDWSGHFAIAGSHAIVPDAESGVAILDVSNPSSVSEVGRCWVPGDPLGIDYHDYRVHVADGELFVLGTSTLNPLPVLGQTHEGPRTWWTVQVTEEDIAYIAGLGVVAVDVSDPTNPTTIGSYNPFGQEVDLSVWNDRVYSAQTHDGLAITDFTDPTSPQPLGTFTTQAVRDVAAYGDFVYTSGDGTIDAVDVTDPAFPAVTSSVPYSDYVAEMLVSGGHLYVCVGTGGVRMFELSDPAFLNEVGTIPAQSRVNGLAVSGNIAYVGDGSYVRAYDVTGKADPIAVAYHETPGTVRCLAAEPQFAIAGVSGAGVYFFLIANTTDVEPLPNPSFSVEVWPNPVRTRANFAYELGWNDRVTLDVYDLAGRLVERLERPAFAQQRGLFTWSGDDRSGRRVANGVYLYRLKSSRGQTSGSLVLKR